MRLRAPARAEGPRALRRPVATTTPGTSRESCASSAGRPTSSTGTRTRSQSYYHGEDFRLTVPGARPRDALRHALFYARSLPRYDIFHFSNAHGLAFG